MSRNIILFYIRKDNLALSKPTWQNHPWPESDRDFGSENAVDGMYTNRKATGGQCTISNDGEYTAEWSVDLGNILNISYINIYHRTRNESTLHYINKKNNLYVGMSYSKLNGTVYDDFFLKYSAFDPYTSNLFDILFRCCVTIFLIMYKALLF